MLAGGQGTTAIALTWIFYILAIHPEVQDRLFTELIEVLGARTPTYEDLRKLTYTRRVIDEVLRLYPPSWLTARRSIGDDEIAGYYIPKGSEIFISPYLTHRHLGFWDDPERFDPDRFSPEQTAQRPHLSYLPFGAGPHMCIGNNFAILAIQVVLSMIARTYRFQLIGEKIVRPQPQILLQPDSSILLKLDKR